MHAGMGNNVRDTVQRVLGRHVGIGHQPGNILKDLSFAIRHPFFQVREFLTGLDLFIHLGRINPDHSQSPVK